MPSFYAEKSYIVYRVHRQWQKIHGPAFTWMRRGRWGRVLALSVLLLLSVLLVACSSPFGGGGGGATTQATPSPTASQVTLAKLAWCSKPLMVFRDNGAAPVATGTPPSGTPTAVATTAAPKTLTDWTQVKPLLDFTTYLPTALPAGTCLVSASGIVHDAMLGSSFTIGYLLADHSAMTFSEAPLRAQGNTFECNPSATSGSGNAKTGTATATATGSGLLLCTGARNTTHIVFSARGTTTSLQQLFATLQPDINWVPVS